ncbi:glycoside hydrolase family 18 protein [Thermococcus sp. 21S9]|uniref:glycosyl hydrolase family 18 protein n=1 Tax=Thermococcus sp. 21S9 TaxID=1638223 RepID=UPI00143C2B5A
MVPVRSRSVLSSTLVLAVLLLTAVPAGASFTVSVYYPSWALYDGFSPSEIPLDNVSIVVYAFLRPLANGTVVYGDPYADGINLEKLRELKRTHPSVRFLVSVGGWTFSENFSKFASSKAGRRAFAESVLAILREYELDGVDVDWEFPCWVPNGGEEFLALVQTLRETLGDSYIITVTAPADADTASCVDWSNVSRFVDYIGLMTYDYAGPWLNFTYFNAPLYYPGVGPGSVNETVSWYLKIVPAKKLLLGIPFYGRAFTGVPARNFGLYQSFENATDEVPYSSVVKLVENCSVLWSERAEVPWAYCPNGTFLTYDDPKSVAEKTRYALAKGLGGVMVWQITEDVVNGRHVLLGAIVKEIGAHTEQNMRAEHQEKCRPHVVFWVLARFRREVL